MSIVIGISGLEKNVGKTSLSLFLGQALHEITKLTALVADLDITNPELKSILEHETTNNYNIDNIMVYASVEGSKLESIIKSNSTTFMNSKLNVIYGTNFKERDFNDVQIASFIQGLRGLYDFAILDLGEREISKNLYNNIDLLLVVCEPSDKYIRKIKDRKDLNNVKTEFVLNWNSKGLNVDKYFKKLFDKQFYATFPFSKDVQININKGFLDFENGEYQSSLYSLAYKILERFSLEEKVSARFLFANDMISRISNNAMVNKIWGKNKETRKDEDRVKSINSISRTCPMLGEILVSQGHITREQLDEALKMQLDEIE